MYAPELKISSLSYRLKGSNAQLYNVDYDKELKRESEKMNKKINEDEKKLYKYDKDFPKKSENIEIPNELRDKLNSLKQTMLTKNKNK